eukprot:TRINITY_DN12060_c0_g1_i1.p2 TRINITY_DN12060_c0_g1~~TRINITY_DN12060_c0_g1_i1.p2  ORF type:complete len:331 (+),score=135.34 TRINITY_DN12060_c0_g1_i1:151-1143(+)
MAPRHALAVLLGSLALHATASPPRAPTASMFPQQFSVVTGTTIPLNHGWDSVTQSGLVHYDGKGQFLRMDHKGSGREVTLIARFAEGVLYLLSGGTCVNVTVNGTLMPFATPKGSVLNQERMIVRDTYVVNYNGVMRGNDGKLHELDFFVKKENRTGGDIENWTPWRISYSKARKREIASSDASGAENDDADDDRDWRFYDEMHPEEDPESQQLTTDTIQPNNPLATLDPVSRITTDYYNFQPGKQMPELFEAPEICRGTVPRQDVKFSFSDASNYGHQIFEFQRTLSELSSDTSRDTSVKLLEDACFRYFCDASEREKNHDAKPLIPDE